MEAIKTYLLAPNFSTLPGAGPIALGSLVEKPLRPRRALSVIDEPTLLNRYPAVVKVTEDGRKVVREAGHKISMSLWAHFLEFISANVSGCKSSSVTVEHTMESLVTERFVNDPDEAEIKARIAEPRVRAVMKPEGYFLRKPVYMVVGLKIATGFACRRGAESDRNVSVEGGGLLPGVPANVSTGASLSLGKTTGESDEWQTKENIIYAYELLKIELKGWKGDQLKVEEFAHKAAYLGIEVGSNEEADQDEDDNGDIAVTVVTNLDDLGDYKGEGVAGVITTRDDDGQVILVVSP